MLSFYKATSALGCGLRQPPPRAAFDSRAATETGRAPPAVGVGGTRRPPLLTSNSVALNPLGGLSPPVATRAASLASRRRCGPTFLSRHTLLWGLAPLAV